MSAFVSKSKRLAYDNIATGSATGVERVIEGGGQGDSTTKQTAETVGTSDACVNSSFIANRPVELLVGWTGATVSDSNVHGPVGTADTDLTPTSATTPGHTSTTSFTSAIHELLG